MDKHHIIRCTLKLAEHRNWQDITLENIAEETGTNLVLLESVFPTKFDILTAFGRMIDADVLGTFEYDSSVSEIENLFDIIMTRFDALEDFKPGIVSIINQIKYMPHLAITSTPYLFESMSHMLNTVQINTDSASGSIKITLLTGAYLKSAYTWSQDTSPDLSKTMAELDKNLGFISGFLE